MEAGAVSREDKRILLDFLRSLYGVLRRLIADRRQLLQPEVRALMAAAWKEIEREGRFEEIEQMLEGSDYDSALGVHGLRGDQLALKVKTFERALGAVERDEERRFVSKRQRRSLRAWLLQTADAVLDSVAAAVPPVAAVQEVKAVGEAALSERAQIRDWVGERWSALRARLRPTPEEERKPVES